MVVGCSPVSTSRVCLGLLLGVDLCVHMCVRVRPCVFDCMRASFHACIFPPMCFLVSAPGRVIFVVLLSRLVCRQRQWEGRLVGALCWL